MTLAKEIENYNWVLKVSFIFCGLSFFWNLVCFVFYFPLNLNSNGCTIINSRGCTYKIT